MITDLQNILVTYLIGMNHFLQQAQLSIALPQTSSRSGFWVKCCAKYGPMWNWITSLPLFLPFLIRMVGVNLTRWLQPLLH